MRLTRSRIQPIGLDLGVDSVKMLQLEHYHGMGSSLSVVAAARQVLPEEARKNPEKRMALAADAVRRMLAQQPFVGRRVVAALPREMVHVKNLRVDAANAADLDAAVRAEVGGLFPFDISDAAIQFLPAGQVRQGGKIQQELIVLAAKRSEVDSYLEQLHSCGVVVDSLDTEITGVFRAFERFGRRAEDQEEVQMFVDIGTRRTQVIIARGKEIRFYRSIEIGGLHLLDAVGRKLGITIEEAKALRQRLLDGVQPAMKLEGRGDPVRRAVVDATRSVAEELGRELAMCLRYYSVTFRGHRPERVRIVGGEAADSQLHATFKSLLSVPVMAARPLYSVDTSRMRPSDRQGTMSQWALAMGLGLRFTTSFFPAKDGKPRANKIAKPITPPTPPSSATAEVAVA